MGLNIPHRTMARETSGTIDLNSIVVTYCDGIGCNASTKAALKMAQFGFHVRELIGGLDWWIRDGHPTTQSHSADAQGNCGCG
jgi:rhodanese-related sulfurtransferase